MIKQIRCVFFAFLLLTLSCTHSNPLFPVTIRSFPDGTVYSDSIGDSQGYRFIDIADVRTVLDSGMVTVYIRVDSLAGSMASNDAITGLNRDTISSNIYVIYEAHFDLNLDNTVDVGDLNVCAYFSMSPGGFNNDSTSLFRTSDFFIYGDALQSSTTWGGLRDESAYVTITGDTIAISFRNSFGVTSQTPVLYYTSYQNPLFNHWYGDSYWKSQ
jgi:hypothetical protein